MSTNVLIDDSLIEAAMRASGAKTKQQAVELGLKTLVRLGQQAEVRKFRGKLGWTGDLEAIRTDK